MKHIQNKTIAIIGGGPGGLTLARLLQQQGADVRVYERDVHPDVRVQGATLDLHEDSGLKALQQAGLIEAFQASYRPGADLTRIIDPSGRIVLDEHDQPKDVSRPEIDRGPLRKLMLASLRAGTVIWDSQLIALTAEGEGWKLDLQNGGAALADIVIAADGANSRVRSYLTPIRPFYVGITALEGAVHAAAKATPTIDKLLKGGKIFAMGDEKTLIIGAKGDGSLAFYAGFKTDENWYRDSGIDFADSQQVLVWFQREFSGWAPLWQELFEKTDTRFIPRPQYCMPLDQRWETRANLTMLGDAAHLMPPYAGEGVNMAMLDALELCNCLTNDSFPDIRTAIAVYEEQMLARFAEMGRMTLEQTTFLHSPGAIENMVSMLQGGPAEPGR